MVNPPTTIPPPHRKPNTILLCMITRPSIITTPYKPNPETKTRPPVP